MLVGQVLLDLLGAAQFQVYCGTIIATTEVSVRAAGKQTGELCLVLLHSIAAVMSGALLVSKPVYLLLLMFAIC